MTEKPTTQIESDIVDEDVIKPSEKMSFPMLLMISLNRINAMASKEEFSVVSYKRLVNNHGRLLQPYFDVEYKTKILELTTKFEEKIKPLEAEKQEGILERKGDLPAVNGVKSWFWRHYVHHLENFIDEKFGLLQELTDRKQLLLQKEGVSDF